jgi:hypothetical protein
VGRQDLITSKEETMEMKTDRSQLRSRLTALAAAAAIGISGGALAACGEDDVQDAASDIENTAEDAASDVEGAAEDAGNAAEDAAEDAGSAAEDAADDVGNAAEDAAEDVEGEVEGDN